MVLLIPSSVVGGDTFETFFVGVFSVKDVAGFDKSDVVDNVGAGVGIVVSVVSITQMNNTYFMALH